MRPGTTATVVVLVELVVPVLVVPVVVVVDVGGRDRAVRLDRLAGLLLLRDRALQRAEDVVVRARVGLHVGRQVMQRVLVAVNGVGVVDPAVVPVVQEELPAGGRGGGWRCVHDGSEQGSGDDRRTCEQLQGGHENAERTTAL